MKWVTVAHRYANSKSIERGEDYVRARKVHDLNVDDGKVSSVVDGSNYECYFVRMSESFFDCSCPYGQKGEYCKHLVATAYLADGIEVLQPNEEEIYESQPEEREEWESSALPGSALEQLKGQIRAILHVEPLDYSNHWDDHWDVGYDYARQIRDAIQLIKEADEIALNLFDRLEAIRYILKVISLSSPELSLISDMGCIHDATTEVMDLHLEVTLRSLQGSDELSRNGLVQFLYWFNFTSACGWIHLYEYASVLGEMGLDALEKRVVTNLDKLDELFLMRFEEDMAISRKNKRAIINLFGGNLASYQSYSAVVTALRKAGYCEEALILARQGFSQNFKHSWRDTREFDYLIDYLISEAGLRNDLGEILRIRKSAFTRNVSVKYYEPFKSVAQSMGVWSCYEGEAEELFRADDQNYFAFLRSEKRLDEMWELFTCKGTAILGSTSLESLLMLRCLTHPEDTIEHYRNAVLEAAKRTEKRAYQRQCELLKLLRRSTMLAVEKGILDDMSSYVTFVEHMLAVNKNRPACLREYREQKIVAEGIEWYKSL